MPVIRKKTEITIALTSEEALWLKLVMQNPVGRETHKDFSMRKKLFESLPDIPELIAVKN